MNEENYSIYDVFAKQELEFKKEIKKKKKLKLKYFKHILLTFIMIFFIGIQYPNSVVFLSSLYEKNYKEKQFEQLCIKNEFFLKNTVLQQKDLQYINELIDPIIRKECIIYQDRFKLDLNTLVNCVKVIATSESGDSKGRPFNSPLWIKQNNPYGIQGSGVVHLTTEEIQGKEVKLNISFSGFKNLTDVTQYLFKNILLKQYFKPVRNSTTGNDFFLQLEKCGYFTSTTWREKYFIPTLKKYQSL